MTDDATESDPAAQLAFADELAADGNPDALRWYDAAITAGNSEAMKIMAWHHMAGRFGLAPSFAAYIALFERAYAAGDLDAAYRLGQTYLYGKAEHPDAKPDRDKALHWLGLAVAGRHRFAARTLASLA